jgi:hypothetical protein
VSERFPAILETKEYLFFTSCIVMTFAFKSLSLLANSVKPQLLTSSKLQSPHDLIHAATPTQLMLFLPSFSLETLATAGGPILVRSSLVSSARFLNTSSTPDVKNGISTKLSENRPRRALFYGKYLKREFPAVRPYTRESEDKGKLTT